jgi:hypothetical protein
LSAVTTTTTIETRTETISRDDEGILRCKIKRTAVHTLEDAKENVRATAQLSNGARLPLILDARSTPSLSREARAYYTGEENAKVVRATAMIIDSTVGKIIGNFFIRVNRPPFPIRLFSTEASAHAWLLEIGAINGEDVTDVT